MLVIVAVVVAVLELLFFFHFDGLIARLVFPVAWMPVIGVSPLLPAIRLPAIAGAMTGTVSYCGAGGAMMMLKLI